MKAARELLKDIDYQMLEAFQQSLDYKDSVFHAQPSDGGWSLQQVLYHMWTVTDMALQVMTKQKEKIQKRSSLGPVGWLRSTVLKVFLWLPLKFKAPANVGEMPNNISYDEMKFKWDSTIAHLHELIETFPSKEAEKPIFKHPMAGWLNMEQTMEFIRDHNEHHQRQLDNLYSCLDKTEKVK